MSYFYEKFDNFLRNEEVRRVQKKMRFICGTIAMLVCGDGLEYQTSSYRFVEWSVCESCKSEEFSDFCCF